MFLAQSSSSYISSFLTVQPDPFGTIAYTFKPTVIFMHKTGAPSMLTVATAKTNSCPLATISAPSQQHRSTLSLALSATNKPNFISHWFLFPLTALAPAAMQRLINSTHAVITSTVSSPCFLLTIQLHAVGAHVAKFEAIIHCFV